MDDPRRILERAAEARAAVEVVPRGGAWSRATVVRVERGGIVLSFQGSSPAAGTDLRCWIRVDGQAFTFEASVLRAAVPVPDRTQGGALLGFLDGFRRANPARGGLTIEALPATGGAVNLVDGLVRVVEVDPRTWSVAAPAEFSLVFAHQGRLRLRFGTDDRAPMEVEAVVSSVSRGESEIFYGLTIGGVEDRERYAELITAVRARVEASEAG
jgi:hypothetical protein